MNRIHRVIWNAVKGCYVAANETTGTSQARGKVAAAVLALTMVAGFSANAATVENGVLTSEEGMSSVVLHNNVMLGDTFAGLEQTTVKTDAVSQMQSDASISGIADGITHVYVGQGRVLTITGSDLDITANLIGFHDHKQNNAFIKIGEKNAAKTTGSFGIISMGLPNLDSTLGEATESSQNQTLTIENAEISIEKLRSAQQTFIDSDAKVDVTTLQSEAMHKTSGIVNHGEVSIGAVETEKKGGYFNNIPGTIENHGKLTIGTTENGFVRLVNEADATSDIDSFVIHTGEKVTTDMDSINRGTLNVADKFVINGASIWGSGTPIIGIFRNEGVFNVGTAEQKASAITINGEMYNSGANAKASLYGDVTVADTNADDEYQTIFSNTDGGSITVDGDLTINSGNFVNDAGSTITIGGKLSSSVDLTNAGTLKAGNDEGEANIKVAGTTFTNTGTLANTSNIREMRVELTANGVLNLAGGDFDIGIVNVTDGAMYVGTAITGEKSNSVSSLSVESDSALHLAGVLSVGVLNNHGTIDAAIFGEDGQTGSGSLVADSVINDVNGSMSVDNLQVGNFIAEENSSASFRDLTITGIGDIAGSVDTTRLILNTTGQQIVKIATDYDTDSASLEVRESVAVNGGILHVGENGSLKVIGQQDDVADGTLSIAGKVQVDSNGSLFAETISLAEGGELVLGNEAATPDATRIAQAQVLAGKGTVTINDNTTFVVGSVGDTHGMTLNFNGANADLEMSSGFYEGATINLNGKSWELKGEGGDGFGVNTVNVNNGSTVSYTDNAVLKNNTTITLNAGGKIEADKIAFEDRYTGGLTLAGGTLSTTLDQIFSEVNADEYIEGTNVETGEIEKIPVSGIQSVGAVKNELTGENGIKYESGAFEFTDDGWTVNAVNSASSMLQSAFDNFEYSESTLIFSGTQDDESGAFGVEDANKLNSNIVLSSTTLDAGGDVTFGEATEGENVVMTNAVGFQGIDNADNVYVKDGHHLYLVGFEGDEGKTNLLTTAGEGTGTINVTDSSKLTLGLDGKKTGGYVAHIEVTGSSLDVASSGKFAIGGLNLNDESTLTVNKDAELSVDTLTDNAQASTVVNGTLAVSNALTANGSFVNTGLVKTGSLASFVNLNNSGRIETAAAFNGTKVVNTGVIESDAAAFFDNLTNSGTVTGTEIEVGDDSAFGSLQNQTGGTIETAGNVTLKLADANSNAGTIKGKDVTVNLADGAAFANTGSIEASGKATFDSVTNSRNISAASVNVGSDTKAGTLQNNSGASITASEAVDLRLAGENANAGQIAGSGVSINLEADAVFTNSGTIKDTSEANHINLTGGEGSKFVNSGALETAGLVISGLNFETTSKVAANSLAVTDGSFTVADSGSVEVDSLDVSGSTLTNKGELSAAEMNVTSSTVTNEGSMTVDKLALDNTSTVKQSEAGLISVKDMTVTGKSFDLDSGTWVIDNENGIKFVDETGVEQAGRINVTSGKEFVTAAADVDNVVYDVTKTLMFGKEAGLADKLGITDATGILVVDKGVEIGATGAIRVGAAIATASARAPQQEANFTVAADSVTIFTGNAFGEDGSEAGIYADPANKLSATIDKDAKAVLTNIQQSGQYKLIEGFDLSANIDKESGEWIGGWTGENGKYVTVDNGSDLEWKTEVTYDKESNTIVADTVAADVRSVYNLATPDIANAALSSSADAAKGADVTFMQAVINNKDLNVAQTERIVNSVTQIAASLGTAANFLSDASGLMDTIETRTGLLSDAGKEVGLWVRVEGGKYKMDGLEIAGGQDAGYDTNTYGVTFGADGMVTDGLRIGAAFSYLNGSADADGDVLSGTNDYDTYGLQAYAAYDVNDTMRVSGELGWFHSSAELAQSISFANVNKAEADVDTDAFTFGIRGDWRFDVNGLAIVPHVGLRGIYMMNDEFTTTIDGKDAFKNDQDNTFTMQIPVGVSVEKAFATASGWNVVPTADVTVAPQFGDTEYDTTVTGIGTGVSQAVTADMAGNVLGRVAFGVKAENGASSFGAYYGFTAGDAGRQDHAFNLSFSYRF